MDTVFFAHVSVFALSALACFAAVPRAMDVGHPETREGLVGLLLTVAVWSSGYVGYLVAPGESLKLAFYIVGFVFALLAVGAWLYFCAAYTGRSPRHAPYRWLVVGVFAAISLLKVTNPLHELYFTTAWVTEPFPHLAIRHELLYWAVLGLSYAIIAVGFFMLIEQFYYAGADSRPLVALISITAIPTVATVFGGELSWLLPLMYEPPGCRFSPSVRCSSTSGDSRRSGSRPRATTRRFSSISPGDPRLQPGRAPAVPVAPRSDRRAPRRRAPRLAVGSDADGVIAVEGVTLDEDDASIQTQEPTRSPRFFHISRNEFTTGGVTFGELLTIDDVTDRERYRIQLEERTEQLEALNRVVRHDIRNDMAVIHGWSETLRDHVDKEGQDALDRVLRKSTHVIELTETARDFVDSLTGDAVLEAKPTDLGTC